MDLIPKFKFNQFKVSIWPTLWGIFFVFCLIIWGINFGQRAPELTHPLKIAGYIQDFIPWIIGAAIFFNPKLGLVFLIFALALAPAESGGMITESRRMKMRMEDYLIPFLYLIWMSRMWLKGKMRLIKVPLTPPIVYLTLSLTFSTIIGVLFNWVESPDLAIFFWLKQLEYFALFYLIVNLVDTDEERHLLIYSLIFVSVIVSLWAIFQGATGFVFSTGRTGGRAAMPFDAEPATLGEYYVILIPLLLFSLFPRKNYFRTLLNSLIVVGAFLGLLFSLSRGSQVGLFIALPTILFVLVKESRMAIVTGGLFISLFVFFPNAVLNFSQAFELISLPVQIMIIVFFALAVLLGLIFAKRHRLVISLLAVAVVIFSLNPKFITRLSSLTEEVSSSGTVATYDEGGIVEITQNIATGGTGEVAENEYHSFANRMSGLWPETLDAISKNPIFGRGLTSIHVADNYYLRITADAGIIGLFCFLWLIMTIYQNIFKAIKVSKNQTAGILRILTISLLITLTGLLIAGITDDVFIPVKVMMHFWLLVGLFYSAYLRFEPEKTALK